MTIDRPDIHGLRARAVAIQPSHLAIPFGRGGIRVMQRQKQLPRVRIETVALAHAADGTAWALACTLLVATTLVAATLSVF